MALTLHVYDRKFFNQTRIHPYLKLISAVAKSAVWRESGKRLKKAKKQAFSQLLRILIKIYQNTPVCEILISTLWIVNTSKHALTFQEFQPRMSAKAWTQKYIIKTECERHYQYKQRTIGVKLLEKFTVVVFVL